MRFNQQSVDQRVLDIDHHGGQYERHRFISAYHHFVLGRCAKLAKLQPGMSVLDYGCGKQMLREHLPLDVKYSGYDLRPDFSDIDNPTAQNYDVVFAIQVLMYPDQPGLQELVKSFSKITDILIVMLPAQGVMKKHVIDPLLGLKAAADSTFRSTPAVVYQALESRFQQQHINHYFGVADISRWRKTPSA